MIVRMTPHPSVRTRARKTSFSFFRLVGNDLLIEEIKKIIVALSKKVDDIGT